MVQSRLQSMLLGKSQLSTPYMSVIAMLVESYAMESIWTILLGALNSLNHPATQFFGDTQAYIEIIAYLLVLYRVANGRAYGSQRVQEPQSGRNNLSSLHWNHTTTESGAITTRSGADMNIHPAGNKSEPDILQVQVSTA
ncbi:hypothetical protein AGABI1DRAFT_130838 [Agaricus bisporus var. burnettii JB137-S8]|uniref:Uncharacterized protein n=2 Tax=Agaricus bisporus var. burnettii TaxID=192524 RepID=K5X1L9_AGABU|nr:uncharacterized protein AGABI1DRAFT_130838 [Agaricus bisporus var. burnettii JB137-S8]EKM76807.1 hypothetical protein AGABI1DRAFT_130838 [Agaricus bisporus var. burnettii JB137-S8]